MAKQAFELDGLTTAVENIGTQLQQNKQETEETSKHKTERFRSSFVTNLSMWEDFSKINNKMSVSNNSCLNMLISRFVQDNKHLLEE